MDHEQLRSSRGVFRFPRFGSALNECFAGLGLIAFAALSARFSPYTIDDAYIYFRYTANFASGGGLTFNPGEVPRVEGITSPLYAVILVLAPLLDVDTLMFAKALGLGSCLAAGCLLALTARELTTHSTSMGAVKASALAMGGGLYYLTNAYVVAGALSGLETSLAGLAFAAFLWTSTVSLTRPAPVIWTAGLRLGATASLAPLLRPDMGLSVVVMLVALCFSSARTRAIALRALTWLACIGSAYFAWRLSYYGLALPLPFYVKQGAGSFPGLDDVRAYMAREPLMFLLAGAALFPVTRVRGADSGAALRYGIAAALLVQTVYYASIHHVMGLGHRFFLPLSVGLIVLAVWSMATLQSRMMASTSGRRWRYAAVVGVAAWCLGNNLRAARDAQALFLDWYAYRLDDWTRVGRAMAASADGAAITIALNDSGAIPFHSGLPTVDLAGLNNRAIALDRSPATARNELIRTQPGVVFLVARHRADPSSILGWERLSHADMVQLGYAFRGTMEMGRLRDGDGYYLLVYSDGGVGPGRVLADLRARGFIEPAGQVP